MAGGKQVPSIGLNLMASGKQNKVGRRGGHDPCCCGYHRGEPVAVEVGAEGWRSGHAVEEEESVRLREEEELAPLGIKLSVWGF
jgi:hypothetical protein